MYSYLNNILVLMVGFPMPPKQGCPIYGKIRFVQICITCFILRIFFYLWTNLRICPYLVRLLPPPPIILLIFALFSEQKHDFGTNPRIFSYSVRLLPPPFPTRPIALSRLAVFCAHRVNFVGYYPKCQYFSESRKYISVVMVDFPMPP